MTGDGSLAATSAGGIETSEMVKGKGKARESLVDESFTTHLDVVPETPSWSDERPKKKFKGEP